MESRLETRALRVGLLRLLEAKSLGDGRETETLWIGRCLLLRFLLLCWRHAFWIELFLRRLAFHRFLSLRKVNRQGLREVEVAMRGSLQSLKVFQMFHLSRKVLNVGLVNCKLVKWRLFSFCFRNVLLYVSFLVRFKPKDCLVYWLYPPLIIWRSLDWMLPQKLSWRLVLQELEVRESLLRAFMMSKLLDLVLLVDHLRALLYVVMICWRCCQLDLLLKIVSKSGHACCVSTF